MTNAAFKRPGIAVKTVTDRWKNGAYLITVEYTDKNTEYHGDVVQLNIMYHPRVNYWLCIQQASTRKLMPDRRKGYGYAKVN